MSIQKIIGVAALTGLCAIAAPNPAESQAKPPIIHVEQRSMEQMYQKALTKTGRIPNTKPFEEMVGRFPNAKQTHFLLGNVYLFSTHDARFKKARESYTRALEIDPLFAAASINRSVGIMLNSQVETNKTFNQRTHELFEVGRELKKWTIGPKDIFSANYNYGIVQLLLNEHREAATYFERAVYAAQQINEYEPPTIMGEHRVERVYGPVCYTSTWLSQHTDKYWPSAEGGTLIQHHGFNYIFNNLDNHAFANYFLALCLANEKIGRWNTALHYVDSAINYNKYVPEFFQLRALAKHHDGKKEDAKNDYRMYIDMKKFVQERIQASRK
ncbi:MAG: hypothetical protein ABIF10_04750 [Candidatus Woesearchaeota archaeon]